MKRSLRAKTPTVLQMESVECGAASLAMVLAYFGRRVPLEILRGACGVSRDGSKAGNIVRAARSFGLTCKGWKKEPHELRDLPLPLVVFWEFNHFLVVEGWSKTGVYLNDPASGARIVSEDEFDRAFTGVALTFEAPPNFERSGQAPSTFRAIWDLLRPHKRTLAFAAFAGLLLVLPGLAIPVFAKIFVDEFLIGGQTDWLVPLLWGMVLTAVLRAGLVWAQDNCLTRLHTALSLQGAGEFFAHLLRLPAAFYGQRSSGEVASRVELNESAARLIGQELVPAALSMGTALFFLALMAFYDWPLTLCGLALTALGLVVSAHATRRSAGHSQRAAIERGKLLGEASGGLQLIETLKATGAENEFFARWSGQHAKSMEAESALQSAQRLATPIPTLSAALTFAVVLVVGGLRVMRGDLSVGSLVAFQSLLAGFSLPVSGLIAAGSAWQEIGAGLGRLSDIRRYPLPEPSQSPDVTRLSGGLELRGVSFGYNPLEAPLLPDFDLQLQPGARVALVGASGSGKSTVGRLVGGLWQPWSGEILFDGRPRNGWHEATICGSVGFVSQETWLFGGTIFDNLTLWDDSIAREDVVRAAHDAQIHEVIAARAGGYESMVSEGGANFSGGQRQRLEIARALCLNPSILVLDEATSALDADTEKRIDSALRSRGCTCLIVAHRLSTTRDCDEILVLERGRIIERGSHDSLVKAGGHYAKLVENE